MVMTWGKGKLSVLKDKKEIQHRALLEVVRFFGSVQAYGDELGVSRARVSNWVNQGNAMPYDKAVVTEEVAKISIDRLSPSTERANEIIKRLRSNHKLLPIEISINNIFTEDPRGSYSKKNHPIVIDSRGVLISGLEQLKEYKAAGMKKILAIVLEW